MKILNKILVLLSTRQDVILAMILLLAVFMMIIPLPTILVDILIAANFTLSILLLMMAVYIHEPMEFSVFPAVLLITTLYRLALNISTSRLILLQHDAGEIVYSFGSFAVGGNIAVGLIVFAIITIVQFIVITKGSERVAEVGARFSLDGMPGKQMSIDGDMRAGIIDAGEARRQRMMVQKESQLYGAMDGAMKFVKGDAIASIIIIIVNILGGIGVGIFMHGMSAGEAASTYAILSVGDGLIAQIPALLISISAGIIVTRVPGEKRLNLASELSAQILYHRNALWIVAAVQIIFASLPGFPTFIFLALAALIATTTYWISRHQQDGVTAGPEMDSHDSPQNLPAGATPLLLQVAPDLFSDSALHQVLHNLRTEKFEQRGLPLPEFRLKNEPGLALGQFIFLLYNEPILKLTLPPPPAVLADLYSPEIHPSEKQESFPFGGLMIQWLSAETAEDVTASGGHCYKGSERLAHLVSVAIDRYGAELIGVQEARFLMDQMEVRYSELVRELQRQLPVSKVADVLQRLVAEGISVRDLRSIFEALVEWSPKEKDPVMLAEYARLSLRRHITGRQRRNKGWITAWFIGGHIEEMIRESVRQTSAGTYSSLSPEENQLILTEIRQALDQSGAYGVVLVTAIDIRRLLRKLIEKEYFATPVLSFQEIEDETDIKVLGHIEMTGENDETA